MPLPLKNQPAVFGSILLLALFLGFRTFGQVPNITSVKPNPVCQGDSVTITGTNFTGATAVTLGTMPAFSYKVKDSKTIVAYTDSLAKSGNVTVTTPSGKSNNVPITINQAPQPALRDESTIDIPFTNCNGNSSYDLTVKNISANTETNSTYVIDWGDGSPNFSQKSWPLNATTSHTYTKQGYFKIKFTITPPSNGCTRTITYNFYNGANPLASFTTTESTTGLCVPATVNFKIGNWFNNSAGTTYIIDFGDGSPNVTLTHPLNNTNTDQVVSHVYQKSSCPAIDYTATLKVANGCFITTYTLDQIIVREKPKADFSYSPDPGCVNLPVCFTNQTMDGYSGTTCNTLTNFTWDFGDGTTSTDRDPGCRIYSKAGTYTVKLTAGNTTCGSDEITKTVVVNPTSPPPTAQTPVTYCQFETASALTATGTNLLWYTSSTGGTGSTTAPVPSTAVAGTTTYYVTQTLAGQCESPRVAITVTVNAQPQPPGVTSPVQLCKGESAKPLTATGSNLLWYTSSTGGTGSSTAPTPSTANTGNTNYYVSQTIAGCEGPRATILVTVSAIPSAPTVTSPVTYCQNQQASALTANGTGLLWYTSATGGTGTSIAPVPSTATPGKTDYYVSQSNYCGESPRVKIEVEVLAGPSATIAYQKNNLCNVVDQSNPAVQVTLTGTPGGVFSISPSTGLPIDASTGTITPAGATAGTYTITYFIRSSGGCADFLTTTTVTVNSTPSATIGYPPMCSSSTSVSVNLSGTPGGSFTSTAGLSIDAPSGNINPSKSTPGNYTVKYTIAASAPCPGFSTSTEVTITKAPQATISYSKSTLCNVVNTDTTPNPPVKVTRTGTTGGTFTISPANGLKIDASGTIDPSGATPGTYTITYTIAASGGCSIYQVTTQVTVDGTPSASLKYPPICSSDGAVNVILTGTQGGSFSSTAGLAIDPATGTITPSNSKPGTYTVTYTIAPSPPCPGFTTRTPVQITESPTITFDVTSRSVCSGQTAVFKPSSTVPNTIYDWNVKGALPQGISGTTAGTVSGANPSINLLFSNSGTTSATITIDVTPVNPTSNPCAGTPHELTLTINPIPAMLKGDTTEFCMHTPPVALTADPDGNNTVTWYDRNKNLLAKAPVINTTDPATYNFYASQTNEYGCESDLSPFVAVVHPVAQITSSSYTNPTSCGIPSGSITLNVVDLNGSGMPNLPVRVHYTKFQTDYTVADNTDASGRIIIPLTAGTYSDFSVETFGCASQTIPDVFVLKDPNPPAQPVGGYNDPLCSESVLNLSASSATSDVNGAINYVWVGPAFGTSPDTSQNTTVSFPSANTSYNGVYIVYAIQNNCISLPASFSVDIKQSPVKPVITTRTPLCIGDNLSLTAISSIPGNNTLNYVWNGPGTGFPVYSASAGIAPVKIEDGGVYSVTVTSPETGCSATADTLIQVGAYPDVKFSKDSFFLPTGHILQLTPAILNASDQNVLPIAQYAWTPPDNVQCNDGPCSLPTITVKQNVCYAVKATNIYGCSGSDTVCISTFCSNAQVFIPNAFVPKGAASNATFMIRASGIASVKSFRIFNRWGRIVFAKSNFPPNDPAYGWNGYIGGKLADMGVYVYTVEVVCENGTPFTYKGNVTLIQ